jgi:hypothetical protein
MGFENVRDNFVYQSRFMPIILFSAMGVLWIVIFKLNVLNKYILISTYLFPVLATFFVWDQSRIIQLTCFMTTLRILFYLEEELHSVATSEIVHLFILFLLVPWVWIWQAPLTYVTPYDFMYFLSKIFHIGATPNDFTLGTWPFPRATI